MALSWLTELSGEEAALVRAVVDAATAEDGNAPVSEAGRLRLRPGPPDEPGVRHLMATADDGVLGYAQVEGSAAELVVRPAARRRGVGAALVGTLLERVPSPVRVWAHGEHPGAAALAVRYGFTRERVLLRLRRALDTTTPEPVLPDGVRLRPFVVGRDEAEFVAVNNRAFAWHPEQGRWQVRDVLLREAEPWFDPTGFLLAVDADGRILGYHWTKTHGPELGEVYVLGVDPDQHGRGLGGALTNAGLRHLCDGGRRTVMLYVESDNEPALRTYRRLGFEHWDTDVQYVR